jgi:hypothetical protein
VTKVTHGDWLQTEAWPEREQMADRRFLPPWTSEETDACFVVKDSVGQKLP